jgi:hypothetical protein
MKFWSKKLNLGSGNWEKQNGKVCGCGLNSAHQRYLKGIVGGLLWTRQWLIGCYIKRRISEPDELLLASQASLTDGRAIDNSL